MAGGVRHDARVRGILLGRPADENRLPDLEMDTDPHRVEQPRCVVDSAAAAVSELEPRDPGP